MCTAMQDDFVPFESTLLEVWACGVHATAYLEL